MPAGVGKLLAFKGKRTLSASPEQRRGRAVGADCAAENDDVIQTVGRLVACGKHRTEDGGQQHTFKIDIEIGERQRDKGGDIIGCKRIIREIVVQPVQQRDAAHHHNTDKYPEQVHHAKALAPHKLHIAQRQCQRERPERQRAQRDKGFGAVKEHLDDIANVSLSRYLKQLHPPDGYDNLVHGQKDNQAAANDHRIGEGAAAVFFQYGKNTGSRYNQHGADSENQQRFNTVKMLVGFVIQHPKRRSIKCVFLADGRDDRKVTRYISHVKGMQQGRFTGAGVLRFDVEYQGVVIHFFFRYLPDAHHALVRGDCPLGADNIIRFADHDTNRIHPACRHDVHAASDIE